MRYETRFSVLGLLCAAQAALGCAADNDREPNPCDAKVCDIRERACQEDVVRVLNCMRGGDDEVMPDVEVISEEDYIELIRGAEPTEAEQLEYERFNRGMALLELAPEEADNDATIEEYASQVAAAYLTDEQSVVIIDRGEPLDSARMVQTLAHEMVHALQDEAFDLERFYGEARGTLDGMLASRALIEGEATHYDTLVFAATQGVPPSQINWRGFYSDYQLDMLLLGYEDESPLALSFVRFPYAFGGDYVTYAWSVTGQRGIRRLFDDPPLSTAEVILFSRYDDEAEDDIAALREVSQLAPIEGYEHVVYDELGSYVIDNFLHRMEASDAFALDTRALQIWGDGVTVLYDAEADQIVVAWRLRFEAGAVPGDALVGALREALDAPDEDAPEPDDDVKARVYADDRDLFIFVSDGALPEAWLGDGAEWIAASPEGTEEQPAEARWAHHHHHR